MMPTANIHASCVVLGQAGRSFGAPTKAAVLILGQSGAGKSTLALQLIAAGAKLVSDDCVELFVRHGRLMARAPRNICGFLEVHGLGIVELAYAAEAAIALVVKLSDRAHQRLPRHGVYKPPKTLLLSRGKWPPVLVLNRSDMAAPAKVAIAVAAFENNLFRERAKEL